MLADLKTTMINSDQTRQLYIIVYNEAPLLLTTGTGNSELLSDSEEDLIIEEPNTSVIRTILRYPKVR